MGAAIEPAARGFGLLQMNKGNFHVYLNLNHFAAAWAAYRGVMLSVSTFGTGTFRPISYWPFDLLRKAAGEDQKSLIRFSKEMALEMIRRQHYPHQVSRLHGIYLWGDEESAIRCEEKWRPTEGQHFDRENLVEISFAYSNLSRVDTQWIDDFLVFNDQPLDGKDQLWMQSYWQGKPRNDKPHWEMIVEGKGLFWGTAYRMRAFQEVQRLEPTTVGYLESGKLATLMGDDNVNNISPFIFSGSKKGEVRVVYCMDHRKMSDPQFQIRLGKYVKTQPQAEVNWEALNLLRTNPHVPDLRHLSFSFDTNLLAPEAKQVFWTIVTPRNFNNWPEV